MYGKHRWISCAKMKFIDANHPRIPQMEVLRGVDRECPGELRFPISRAPGR
jgi:hypothetical protein